MSHLHNTAADALLGHLNQQPTNYLINRVITYLISDTNISKDIQTIDYQLKANGYQQVKARELIHNRKQHTKEDNNQIQKKWASFTYVGRETKFITKLLKDFNVNIAYHTRKTISSLLNPHKLRNNKHEECGIYELKCKTCPGTYIGQTGHNFKTRFKEHIQDIRNNRSKTGFSQHILTTGHAYDNMENMLKILNTQGKSPYLNTLEKFHIYKTKKSGNLLNENCTDTYNPIFELLL
jgi:hypothetical protein